MSCEEREKERLHNGNNVTNRQKETLNNDETIKTDVFHLEQQSITIIIILLLIAINIQNKYMHIEQPSQPFTQNN